VRAQRPGRCSSFCKGANIEVERAVQGDATDGLPEEDDMTDITRRMMCTGAAAIAGGSLMTPAVFSAGAAPLAGTQAPGWYRYKVGGFEVTVVTDGVNRFKLPDDFVTNVKKEDVQAQLAAVHMDTETFYNPYNPIVINTGSKLVLMDTGTGEAANVSSKGAIGQLQANLAAAGIDPKSFDAVVISHYHGDHINGLLKADNTPAFPNAEVLVPANEHKYWMDDGEMSRAPKGRIETNFKNVRRVFNAEIMKRLRTYEWDKEVIPGLTALGTPGHSPGHTSFVLASGASKVYVQADVTHVPFLFVRHPEWHAFYDQDPGMAETTRRKVYDMLVADRMMVQGFHYPFPSHAFVERNGSGYREIAVPWNATL
jgi:glyoxylase-like metal-dependent hydrolase (beta-lactamase superfamily II)